MAWKERRLLLPLVLALCALAAVISVAGAAAGGGSGNGKGRHEKVRSKTDAAVQSKLSPDLQTQVENDSTAPAMVAVTLDSSAVSSAARLLTGEHVATKKGISLMIGTITSTKLAKLASLKGVGGVTQIQFKQTGGPTGNDPEIGNQPDVKQRKDRLKQIQSHAVPYDQAPPLKGSNFQADAKLNVLDAKTHDFTGAWQAGDTGTGVTASVLDGGTDWGHPDLINTWQTWSSDDISNDNDFVDQGWVGWPKAFDPYSTLVLEMLGPDAVAENDSWYTTTQAATCTYVKKNGQPAKKIDKDTLCAVTFATRTGPARNFSAPAGTNTHTYTFPASWTKSGTVKLTSHPDDYLLQLYGERPAVLVTDPNQAGVYDTVYVDLNDDHSFGDEKPVTKSSPVSYRDIDGDGYADLSGGLLYYISDGHTTIPGGPTDFGDAQTPASGDFLAWSGDFDPGIEGHGTLTASNVVGQAVINGKAPQFADLPGGHGHEGGTIPGMVLGGAPNAKLAPMGDVYFSFSTSTQFAYLLTNEYGVQVTSNSYGTSTSDNDGMDAASIEADSIHNGFGNATTPVFSTGNGAPGYGTATAPAPANGIQVGASTNFGSTGWDSIANYSQVTDNDVIEWSNRGPGANGRPGVDVVADGSYAPGDATLNTILNGQNAWATWGGTSRSTPVTVGAVALIEEAYKKAHGSFPTEQQVKVFLKSGAKDLGYEPWIQGAGSVDAGKSVAAAGGSAPTVSPTEWRPGTSTDPDQLGRARFPVTIAPGGSASQSFSLGGSASGWTVGDRVLKQYASDSFNFQSQSESQESTSNFDVPDYLIDITDKIKAHPDADIVVIRATYPWSEFDGNGDNHSDQAWRLLAYNWTDVNHDGKLWTDKNGNGVVNHEELNSSSNIDNFNDVNWKKSEIEQGEYERFFYHRPGSNVLMGFIRQPAKQMANGIFLGFQHSTRNPAIDKTDFRIEIDYYKNVDWDWATETAPSGGSFTATVNVPSNAPTGMYEGAITATKGSQTIAVPVSVTVAPTIGQNDDGSIAEALHFGGTDVAKAQASSLYDNGSIFGANDWTWREESGDWRFFWFNVQNLVPDGTLFLSDTTWDDATNPQVTDLDTLLFGPTLVPIDAPAIFGGGAFSSIDTVGASQNAYLGSGTWGFNTATGGPEEVVAGPAAQGPNAVVQHGVRFDGDKFNVPFSTTLGSLSVNPTSVDQTAADDGTGTFDVTVESSLDLAGLSADAFGLSQPESAVVHATQDDQSESDPSSASAKVGPIAIGDHASRATFTLPDVQGDEDLDLFVVYDANNDGQFTNGEIVGSSTGPAGANEEVTLIDPAAGNYQVWVYGYQVSAGDSTAGNTVGIDVVQGDDIVIENPPSGPLAANTPYTLHLSYSGATGPGDYEGELQLGPTVAPSAVTVPITIHPSETAAATTASTTTGSTTTGSTTTTDSTTSTSTTTTTSSGKKK
jgi:hypothetical protein